MADLYTAKPDSIKRTVAADLPPTNNPLATFATNPLGFNFENQRAEEVVLLLLRQHWVKNLKWIFLGILLIFFPPLFGYFPAFSLLPLKYQLVVYLGWYLLLAAFIFEKFLTWFFNVGIITDRRVVDVDFYGLLFKEISDAEFDKIQDVTLKQIGATSTLFDFGDIFIQTAGGEANIEFEGVPHPRKVVKLLEGLRI